MRNHILICGFGATGQAAAKELLNRGEPTTDIVVVDKDPDALDAAARQGFVSVAGDATKSTVLEQAGVRTARAVIVAPNRDDTAVLITLTVREINADTHIVAGARERENLHLLRQGGANEVIDATVAVGRMIGLATTTPGAVRVVDDLLDSGTGLDLVEIEPAAPDTVPELPANATLIAVIRNGARVLPDAAGSAQLEPNDRLIVLR